MRFSLWQESNQRDMVWEGVGLAQETALGGLTFLFSSPLDTLINPPF